MRVKILAKIILAFAVLSIISTNVFAESAGLGTYSEGYRIGQVSKFSVKGLMFKSGEGQMLVGNESTPYIRTYKCGDSTCKKTVNPWYFSATKDYGPKIDPVIGDYAVLRYTEAQVKMPNYDTPYMIKEVLSVEPDLAPKECNAVKFDKGSKSEGKRVGRIVKASQKGHLNKTYEVQMQMGNSGNQFKNMTISDPTLYECAVKFLKSGKKVKVEYSESFIRIPGLEDTAYDIVSIKRASSGLGE